MLIVVAVDAQQLPVAAVQRVVVMIVDPVMNREHAQVFAGKLTRTLSANPGVHFKRLFAISLFPLFTQAPSLSDSLA